MSFQENLENVTSESWIERALNVGENPEFALGLLVFVLISAVIRLYWDSLKKEEKIETMLKETVQKMTEVNKFLDDNTIERKIDEIAHGVNNVSTKIDILHEKLK